MARGKGVNLTVASGSTLWKRGVDRVYGGLKADEILRTLRKLAEKALAP